MAPAILFRPYSLIRDKILIQIKQANSKQMKKSAKASLMTFVIFASGSICCFGQMNVTSPSATEFVRYERIPVSYFNGLPSIDIPLYTLEYKDLNLPLHLSYYASGIQLNQYPTMAGLGWNLNAGGCITRVVNGIHDETSLKDIRDQTGQGHVGMNPGYYFCSQYMDGNDWASEDRLFEYVNASMSVNFDSQPDEFVINAYGVSGSVYFYRDKDDKVKSKVRSNNGESFIVDPPVVVQNPQGIEFKGGSEKPLKAYRVYELFYQFTVTKNDGTKLIFGGDYNCIEFYTERNFNLSPFNKVYPYMKTWPSAWMLKEVISPDGNKITFTYQRDGNPIIISDVRTDLATYSPDGNQAVVPSQDPDRGISFIVQHPVYPQLISVDNGPSIDFMILRSNGLSTVGTNFERWMQYYGFSDHLLDPVCYNANSGSYKTPYAPQNYSMKLYRIDVRYKENLLRSFTFSYKENKDERIKLQTINTYDSKGRYTDRYSLKYNSMNLPPYNSTVTDNWGYWNNKDYRKTSIGKDFFEYRSANETYTEAEVLTEITYPTGGHALFEYELNDYSLVATQAPDFKILSQSGKAGGLRIKNIIYTTDTTSYTHSFEYINEDGSSSGILSGIPVYIAQGDNYYSYDYSTWQGLVHFHDKAEVHQSYKMWSEAYINALGLTTGNYVTYSRVLESVGKDKPLVKEYRYTNHNNWPDTADFKMLTNIDNVSLDNKFTSRALMRGLLTDEIWYNDGKKVKEINISYNSSPARFDDYAKSIEKFTVPGLPGNLIRVDFIRYAPFKTLTFYPYIESRTETLYDPSGQTVMSSITEDFTYNGNLMPKTVTKNMSTRSTQKISITYPDDYQTGIFKEMVRQGRVSSPVEIVTYTNGKVTGGKLTEYKQNNSIIIPYMTWRLGLTESIDSSIFTRYSGYVKDSRYYLDNEIVQSDSYGNPLLMHNENGIPVSYKWGYSSAYPTAIVSNAANTYKVQTVWEPALQHINIKLNPSDLSQNAQTKTFNSSEQGDVNITLAGELDYDWYVYGIFDGQKFNLVETRSNLPLVEPWNRYEAAYKESITFKNVQKGYHTLTIQGSNARKNSTVTKDRMGTMSLSYTGQESHIVITGQDEFFYEDFESSTVGYPFGYHSDRCFVGEYNVRLNGDSDRRYILDYQVYKNGQWKYVRKYMPGRSYVIDEGQNPIDDIRVRPEDSEIETYTWYPLIGLRSRTDGGGVTGSYIYDADGRLQAVRDNSNDIVHQYGYHYAGNRPKPEPMPYGNAQISMTFKSNLCDKSEGYLPVPVTYTVPAYRYRSHESQSEANRMAFDDLIANGQKYADEHGQCEANIMVSVYNPTQETYTLHYIWGPQGNTKRIEFTIPPGESGKADDSKDLKPTLIYVPRNLYKTVFILNSDGDEVPFKAESGYDFTFDYTDEYYESHTDTYFILQ